MKRLVYLAIAAAILASGSAQQSRAAIRITEWMYNPGGTSALGEFVELTNVGAAPIDMTGWSYDDSQGVVGKFSLSGFGVVTAGESVIFTDDVAADFRTAWGLAPSVKVVGGYTDNLGRADKIHIFDAGGTLVDALEYGDEVFAGTIRTNGDSGNPLSAAALGANNPALWVKSAVGDAYGSHESLAGDVGNPGIYIPEPASLALAGMALAALGARRRS